jgi:hypothetical protein
MGQRGRSPGFRMSDEHRVKIQNSNILNALIEHVEGTREMAATQVTAGVALMKKVLPDLQSMTLSGDPENPIATRDVTDLDRAKALAALVGKAKEVA